MMSTEYFYEEEGFPFTGRKLEKLKAFLEKEGLSYDETAEYTLALTDEEGNIAAAGSVAGNVLKCIAVSGAYRGEGLSARLLTGLVNYCTGKGRLHLFLFTKPSNRAMFTDLGFSPILCTDSILFMENKKNGIRSFLEQLKEESRGEGKARQGAIVANCNPFTKGHAWLIRKALEDCDLLHLFILSEDRSEYSASDRMEMVRRGLEEMRARGVPGMERVILHGTSDYLISSATFPTYFIKDKAKAEEANCELDVRIFAECIAAALGITKRFAGTEPADKVTAAYNRKMAELLPEYGIEFVEIPRLEAEVPGREKLPISAKQVRKALAEGKTEELKILLPDSTLSFLQKKSFSGTNSDC